MANVQRRLPIALVGDVWPAEDGGIRADGWRFKVDWMPEDTEVPLEDATLGGWTGEELHTIAHGSPCDCPVGRR